MAYKDMEKAKANWRKWDLIKRWGITPEDFEEMLESQNGVCAICKQPEKDSYKRRLSIDHDHVTGKIRGLLCHMCNTGLGKYQDNPDLLISASNYLIGQK